MIYIWMAVIILSIVIEAATVQLVTVWFVFGALAALITELFGGNLTIQLVVFTIVSITAIVLMRPVVKRWMSKNYNPTNADRCIGKTALVVENIDNSAESGAVKINGVIWTARSAGGENISSNEQVIIKEIDGVKLIVEKKE